MTAPTRHTAAAALLIALALAIYLPVSGFGIVNYDDDVYLTAPPLAEGLSGHSVAWAFTTFYHSNWHPLTWLSWLTEIQLFGPRAGALHAGNALLHAANGALLYAALFRMTRKALPSLLAAALFAVHPMHVESVAWISERKDVLCVFFGLCALLAYARYAERPRQSAWLLVVTCFALSLLAKPMLVTLPFSLLLLDAWPLARAAREGWRRLVLEKVPLLALSAGSCALTWLAQSSGGAVRTYPLATRVASALSAYAGYLAKTFVPIHLAALYPRPVAGPDWRAAALSAALLVGISAIAWRERRRAPWLAVGWAWFLGTLVPVIGLVPLGEHAMADRYVYWPHVGLFVALAFSVDALLAARPRPLRLAAGAACAACVAVLAAFASAQTQVWKDSETLWRHALEVTRDNYVAHANLGRVLQQTSPAEAQLHFGAALAINPDAFRPVASPSELRGAQSDR
jgi:hypothetical protein